MSPNDLRYAATARCPCGDGLAYPTGGPGDTESPMKWPFNGYWDCAGIFLGTADPATQHTAKLPFVFYEIKDEGQPSAKRSTTRPTEETA